MTTNGKEDKGSPLMTEKPAAPEVSDSSSPSHLSEMITETNGDEKIPTAYLKDTNSSSLPLCNGGTEKKQKKEYQFGNYKHYYGYRNKDHNYKDIRLDILQAYEELFHGREILDIGCNNGQLTMSIADQFIPKHITGMDIEQSLINEAKKCLIKEKKCLPWENEKKTDGKFPYNVTFIRGDYVLRDDILLEVEEEQNFDVILALSITKWIHLNYGDAGLKQAFRRMYRQLRCHGILILEAQPFDNYKRRKNINATIHEHFKSIQFFPKDFDEYLLSEAVGFKEMKVLGIPDYHVKGFQRTIQMFYK